MHLRLFFSSAEVRLFRLGSLVWLVLFSALAADLPSAHALGKSRKDMTPAECERSLRRGLYVATGAAVVASGIAIVELGETSSEREQRIASEAELLALAQAHHEISQRIAALTDHDDQVRSQIGQAEAAISLLESEVERQIAFESLIAFLEEGGVRTARGRSSEPTIPDGTRFRQRTINGPQDIHYGDFVYVKSPREVGPWSNPEFWIKRVIGKPGDTIEIVDGTVFRNDVELDEPYVVYQGDQNLARVELGPHEYWVEGDNRGSWLEGNDRMVSVGSHTSGVGPIPGGLIAMVLEPIFDAPEASDATASSSPPPELEPATASGAPSSEGASLNSDG